MRAGCLLQRLGRRVRDRRREDLAEWPVRLAVLLEAASAQHEPALGSSLGGDLGGEPGGADAGRTRQEDEGAAAVEGAVHHHPDVPSLLVAVDEAVGGGHDPWDLLDLTWQELMQ